MAEHKLLVSLILTILSLDFVILVESQAACKECFNGKNDCSNVYPCGNHALCFTDGTLYCIEPIIDVCAVPDVETACLPSCDSGWIPLFNTTCKAGVCCVKVPS
ncbi:uncharacterized protein LOC115223160 [Octopus sinensis]|uniref:Uncharacterized protein LOC115223160 n=1 Tax=Octopus sinensis TaxID=2607531 RepID=A0A6P7TI43_9MOLL|nr:uncharacterized protein LOC115223160 [Octopus sinensis]